MGSEMCIRDRAGLTDLGMAFESEEKKNSILDKLAELFATNTRDNWINILRSADIVAAPVNTMLEASQDPNIVESGYVKTVTHPELGEELRIHGTPWKMSETPSNPGFAPKLGEHNEEILGELGYDSETISHLKEIEAI